MNVLSLFDGMSCGRIALDRAGITVDNYFSSEIDKYAIEVANYNYPQDEKNRLGSVVDVDGRNLPKIDLLIGGSPCQSFSFAGKRNGMTTKSKIEITTFEQYLELKENNFEFEGQSYLFWEYIRLLKECNPKYFLLENVKMSKKWQDLISSVVGVSPIQICSSSVSAQQRKRLYWTNIKNIEDIQDKNIKLIDILEKDAIFDYNKIPPRKDNDELYINEMNDGEIFGTFLNKSKNWGNGVNKNNKAYCLRATCQNGVGIKTNGAVKYRWLTPLECERLQTVPEGYTSCVKDSKRIHMLGNGWTVDVISHILKHIKE